MNALTKFLTDLAIDPDLQQALVTDPEGTMRRAGLDPAERNALVSRNRGQIADSLGGASHAVFADPGPDPTHDPDPPEPDEEDEQEEQIFLAMR